MTREFAHHAAPARHFCGFAMRAGGQFYRLSDYSLDFQIGLGKRPVD
jgi:hypothetical protein